MNVYNYVACRKPEKGRQAYRVP